MARKKNYRLRDFCGIDTRWGNAEKNSLSYIKNMMPKDGVLTKRRGWRVLHTFRSGDKSPMRINGIFEYGDGLIIHAGDQLYRADRDLRTKEKIKLDKGALLDQRSCGFVHSELLYLCGGGVPLIYDGETVKTVFSIENAYVPVTSRSVPDSEMLSGGEEDESPNLLTGKRVNALRGKSLDDPTHVFRLDAAPMLGTPFTLTVRFKVSKTGDIKNDITSGYVGLLENGEEFRGEVTATMHTDSLGTEAISSSELLTDEGKVISLRGNHTICCSVKGDVLSVHFNCPTPSTGKDNMRVDFTASGESHILDKVEHFCPATMENGRSILFLACGDNRLIYTHPSGDLSYLPEKNLLHIGRSGEPISAILPMSDNYVSVYKKNGFYRVHATESQVAVYSSEDTEGCVNPFAAVCKNGECLTLSHGGVYGIESPDSRDKIITRLICQSEAISELLSSHSKEDFEKGAMCVWNGCLYLFLGDYAYVAEKQGGEYRWYMLSPCRCYCPTVLNGTLYMGRENGDIAVFYDGYSDRQTEILSSRQGDFLLQNEDEYTYAVFNKHMGVSAEDKISFDTHYALFSQCTYRGQDGGIVVPRGYFYDKNMRVCFYEGMKIKVCDIEGNTLCEGEIVDTSPYECVIYTDHRGGEDRDALLYVERDADDEYTLFEAEGNLLLMYDSRPAKLFDLNIPTVYVVRDREVEATLHTQPLDLGTTAKKNLYRLELTPTPDTEGRVGVGYQTRRNAYERELILDSALSLDSLDFNVLGFNPAFKRTLSVPCLERSFDYAKIKVSSHSPRPFGIEEINLTYSQGRE